MVKNVNSSPKKGKLAQVLTIMAYVLTVIGFIAAQTPAYSAGASAEYAAHDQKLQDSHKVYHDLERHAAVLTPSHSLGWTSSEKLGLETVVGYSQIIHSYTYFHYKRPLIKAIVIAYSPSFTLAKICCRRI